jgi:tRNA-Thr(GGU) m(6)t(6)A37 methyltransferase TsaA
VTTISYQPIGIVHSPFEGVGKVPIQPTAAAGIRATVTVFDQFAAGLKDLEGFSHVILLYHFHRITQTRLTVIPFMDDQPRGVFATRAPSRPNPIGLSIVKLLGIEGTVLHIENVDIVDGTPLLDIKPYVPQFDHHQAERTGWLENSKENIKEKRSDDRFS